MKYLDAVTFVPFPVMEKAERFVPGGELVFILGDDVATSLAKDSAVVERTLETIKAALSSGYLRHLSGMMLKYADEADKSFTELTGRSDQAVKTADLFTPLDDRRAECHRLIDRLDPIGLPVAVESLEEMVKFYPVPAGPARKELPAASIPATISEVAVRPVFPIQEE